MDTRSDNPNELAAMDREIACQCHLNLPADGRQRCAARRSPKLPVEPGQNLPRLGSRRS